MVPICWAFNIMLTALGGLVVFDEYRDFTSTTSEIMFAVGILVTLSSVLALSTIKHDRVAEERLRRRSTMYQLSPSWTYQGAQMSNVILSLDDQHGAEVFHEIKDDDEGL